MKYSRVALRAIFGAVFLGLLFALFWLGYLAHRFEVEPVHNLANMVERKLNKISGRPSPTEERTARVESTFVRLRGEVYELPDNDYVNGGALTVWGDDLVILHRTGALHFLELGEGIVKSKIMPPDNGVADYIELAETDEYRNFIHKPTRIRFNDVEYVDHDELHGLALSYTFFDRARECYGTRVSWLAVPRETASVRTLEVASEDWETIFETSPCLELNPNWTALDGMMAGGRMAVGTRGALILGSGEYHLDGVHTYDVGIQSDDVDYGKVIAIDLATRTARHVSKGHRNLQGVTVDASGRIWVTEHGVRGGDELNLIRRGGNYGWPLETLGTLYSGQPFPSKGEIGRHTIHTPPVYAWLPSAAVSSLMTIAGFHPSWDGDLLAGSLATEEQGQSLYRIRVRENRVVFVERIKLKRRIRYLTQYGPDKIAVWLDTNELVLLSVEPRLDPLANVLARLDEQFGAELAPQIARLLGSCNECHSFEQSNHANAPSLNGVVGRRIAGTAYEAYSSALKSKPGVWSEENLKAYLVDAAAFAPGTTMPAQTLSEGVLLDGLVWALQNVNTTDDTHLTYD